MSSTFSNLSNPQFRRDGRDFSRGGPLQPELLVTLLLFMVADGNRRGYAHVLDAFWDEARGHGLALPTEKPVSAASFCVARRKIPVALLKRMIHDLALNAFREGKRARLWRDRRVYAVDGAKLNLQRDPDLERFFGVPEGAHCPQALVSVMLDVCARLPVDVQVSPFASCERTHLLEMLPSLTRGDVLVLDRGYPSHEIIQELCEGEIDFLIRVPASNSFAIIDEVRESGSTDRAFTLLPPPGGPSYWGPRKLRIVRITAPDGSESFFITSLPRSSFSRAQLRELYHMRWEIEEFFKLSKGSYIGQGQFRSKSPSGVTQEIHALILFLAITRVCMEAAARVTGREYDSMSQKAGVLGFAAHLTRILLAEAHDDACLALHQFFLRLTRPPEKRRPGRSYPRRSFRPAPRWGPSGRRGA